jgi:predicted nucleic acid-binding protein
MGEHVRRKRTRSRTAQALNRPVLLDTSFLIALERETSAGELGPARRFLTKLKGRRAVVSVVAVEELLEGAADDAAAMAFLIRFSIQGIQLAQARRCALVQRRATRRLGENDAWLVATAQVLDADVVGADRRAFDRLGSRYLRFR